MNRDTQFLSSVRLLMCAGLTLCTLTSCRDELTKELVINTPTQRIIATKTLFLGISGVRPAVVDTVRIQGKIYESAAFDSTTFTYDQQDRLIRLDLLQSRSHGPNYSGEGELLIQNTQLRDYSYQPPNLLLTETDKGQTTPTFSQSRLDGSSRRIASRSWYDSGNFATVKDTLQLYSPEGILISSQRIILSTGYPRQTHRQTSTLTAGNIAQTTSLYDESGKISITTTYAYDLTHTGPLATQTMFGENSRHALVRATTVRNVLGVIDGYEYTYANEYDLSGRMIRQTTYYQPSGSLQRELRTLTKFYYQ